MHRCRAISRRTLPGVPAGEQNALAPGGEEREIATLFTDIAEFTPLCQLLDPKQLAELLSGDPEGMTEVVFAHEGTVAKIIGDAIHGALRSCWPINPMPRAGRLPARLNLTRMPRSIGMRG